MAELPLWRSYAVLIGSRLQSQTAYRTSFGVAVLTSVGFGAIEFIEIFALLSAVPTLGGLNLAQASLVFALANMGFALADFVFGQFDSMPSHLRLGRVEVLMVRPMPLIAQFITADFQLRRLGRVAVGLVIMIIALSVLRPEPTPAVLYLLISTPVYGGMIFGALFVAAGGLQFFLIDGAEFTSAFVYGGSYAAQIPGSVLLPPLQVLFTFVVPATATAYLPCLLILGLQGPELLPSWLGWCVPALALWAWLLALLCWRLGLRHFSGAGG